MSVRIKSDKIHALAREVATLSGKTMTSAIRIALEERLEAIRAMKSCATAQPEEGNETSLAGSDVEIRG